jgi:alpha-galactosidase
MGIVIDQQKMRAHLFTKTTSYVVETFEGELLHSYWGKRIELPSHSPIVPIEEFPSFYPNPNGMNKTYSLETIPREYPDFGRSDYRSPGYRIKLEDGSCISKFHVASLQIIEGKPVIPGLPSTYVEKGDLVQTLQVEMIDEKTQMHMYLYYCVNESYDVISRYVKFENKGSSKLILEGALSANVDFYNDCRFELIHLNGSWGRERFVERLPIGKSKHVIESKRGASGHHENPMVMLARPGTTDHEGEVYSMNFVYSGNFKSVVEVNSYDMTRFQMGLNDFDFSWILEGGACFDTPEVVMVYSDQGLNRMSQRYHKLYRERLCRGKFKDEVRPILINNWEATYFSFTDEKLETIGQCAGEIGMELFVLDDGWFGKRDSDKSGLGDWFVNESKLQGGLGGLADYMNQHKLEFGLWFEPEMVSVDSDLYRAHPDWCLHAEGHSRTEGRNQLILDFSRRDVQDYIIHVLGEILSNYPINYVKWDMNRNMTESYSGLLEAEHQQETTHRYMLGLYRVLETITRTYDQILFESCSGGGGRFDPGMLYYMPQTWTSDDTDAYERQFIQYGTSFAYPSITMGSHVSVSPNHQTGRVTPLQTRAFVAMMANLGYELDLSMLSKEEIQMVTKQVAYYKSIRRDIQFGNYYRLLSPFEGDRSAALVESEDGKRYYLFYFTGLNRPNHSSTTLPLRYLSEGNYSASEINFDPEVGPDAKTSYPASYLNHYGYCFKAPDKDFQGHLIVFTKEV